jgi:hypothetical protein
MKSRTNDDGKQHHVKGKKLPCSMLYWLTIEQDILGWTDDKKNSNWKNISSKNASKKRHLLLKELVKKWMWMKYSVRSFWKLSNLIHVTVATFISK